MNKIENICRCPESISLLVKEQNMRESEAKMEEPFASSPFGVSRAYQEAVAEFEELFKLLEEERKIVINRSGEVYCTECNKYVTTISHEDKEKSDFYASLLA